MDSEPEILTTQQVALLEYIRQGMPIDQAVRMAGMDFDKAAAFLATDERGAQAVEFSKTLHSTSMVITKDLLTSQFYAAMARSSSTSEDVMCLREIGKMHGLYETKVRVVEAGKEEESEGQKSLKRIQRMDDDALLQELETTGLGMDLLPEKIVRTPKADAVAGYDIEDGEFTNGE